MTFLVRRCLLFFFMFELLIFFMIYCFGPKGFKAFADIQVLQAQERADILQLQQDMQRLQSEIAKNQTSFAKEKVARERLLMKRDDETVYFK